MSDREASTPDTNFDGPQSSPVAGASDTFAELDGEVTRVSRPGASPDELRPTLESWSGEIEKGRTIGRYVVLELIGRGGMGVVYAAFDPHLERRVALKLISARATAKLATADGDHGLLREAQAMAKLSHPNVLAVYDAGKVGDRVFLATEYVEGQTVRSWLKAAPRKWTDVRRVFLAAGRGLAAAHRSGIVHRDFKPHNIMLSSDGVVRVMDFGLARVQSTAELASDRTPAPSELDDESPKPDPAWHAGAVVGTPGYIAPEQYLGEAVGPAADQFAFCVSLFEALYGTRPFVGGSVSEIAAAACTGRVQMPDASAYVPAWLRRLVLRGLSVSPADRWPSLDALLTELGRDSHKVWRRGAALFASVAIVAFAANLYSSNRQQRALLCSGGEAKLVGVWDQAVRERLRDSFAATNLNYATDTWLRVERMLAGQADQWLAMHRDVCEATRIRGEQSEQRMDLLMACLGTRRAELKATVDLFATADTDVVKNAVKIVGGLGSMASCNDPRTLAGEGLPVDERLRPAAEQMRASLAQAKTLHGAAKFRDAAALSRVIVEQARSIDDRVLLAMALFQLGASESEIGEAAVGRKTLEEAAWAADAARLDEVAADAKSRLVFVTGYYLGDVVEGKNWARHAEAAVRRLGHDRRREGKLLYYRGNVALTEGRYAEAQAFYRSAKDALGEALGAHHIEVAAPVNAIGVTLRAEGKLAEARETIEQALTIWREALGSQHPDVAVGVLNLGGIAEAQGRYREALVKYETALAVFAASMRHDHPHIVEAHNYAASAALRLGDRTRAFEHVAAALAVLPQDVNSTDVALAMPLHYRAKVHLLDGELEQAAALERRSLDVATRGYGAEHPAVGIVEMGLAEAQRKRGDRVAARQAAERALDTFERVLGARSIEVGEARLVLCEVELDAERADQARVQGELAMTAFEPKLDPDHPLIIAALTCQARALLAPSTQVRALALAQRAHAASERVSVAPSLHSSVAFTLARASAAVDPTRSETLARAAADSLRDAGHGFADERAQIGAWLARR